jgi:hypothetical protein
MSYAFFCPIAGMYRCKQPDCRCVENWNAERQAELNTPERMLVNRARDYLAANAAESGADVLIDELARALEKRLPVVRQLAEERPCTAGTTTRGSWCGAGPSG